jgi:hypothetical protein
MKIRLTAHRPSDNPFPQKKIPIVFNINDTMIRVQIPLSLGRKRAMSYTCFYSGCQKKVPVFKRFFLQPLMPHFRISEHYYGKRYKSAKMHDPAQRRWYWFSGLNCAIL